MSWLLKKMVTFGLPDWVAAIVIYILFCLFFVGLIGLIYQCGKWDERAVWQAKELAQIEKAKATITQLKTQNTALQKLSSTKHAATKAFYQQEFNHAQDYFNRAITDVRSGAKRLSIATKAVPACSGGISLATTARPDNDAETRTELSAAAAEYVVRFGSEADAAVIESNQVKDLLQQCHEHVDALRNLQVNQQENQSTGDSTWPH